jgi:hypothetical protein
VRCGYYVHYTKWPKRAEEWVPEHVVVPWNEQLARGACTRPPRKDLWENPEASADDGAADEPPPSGAPLAPLKLAAAGAGASDLPLTFSPNASAARLTERQQMALLLKAEADGGAAPVAPAPQPPPAQPRAGGRSGRASGSAADEPDASAKGPAEGRAAAKAAGGGARARGGGARDALADKESEHKDLAAMSALDALAAGAFEASAAHEPATRRQLVGAAAEEEAGSEGEGEGEDGLDGADDESDDDADELLLDADGGEEGEEEAEGDDDGSDGEGEEGSASDGSEQDDEDGEGEENSSADDATDAEDEEADEERAAAHTDGVEPLDVENEDDDIDNASKFRAGRRRGRPGPMSPAMKQAPAFNFSSKQAGTAQALAAALSGKRRKGVPRRAIRSVAPCAELEAWEKGLCAPRPLRPPRAMRAPACCALALAAPHALAPRRAPAAVRSRPTSAQQRGGSVGRQGDRARQVPHAAQAGARQGPRRPQAKAARARRRRSGCQAARARAADPARTPAQGQRADALAGACQLSAAMMLVHCIDATRHNMRNAVSDSAKMWPCRAVWNPY